MPDDHYMSENSILHLGSEFYKTPCIKYLVAVTQHLATKQHIAAYMNHGHFSKYASMSAL